MNLAANARDAMPRGGAITLETSNFEIGESFASHEFDARPGSYVRLVFSDNGSGMSAETRARIFEPFFTTGTGTGLGLATVYGIVRQSNGIISVSSEPGQGARFEIYFPRIASFVEKAEAGVEAKPAERGQETILVVEDQDQLRRLSVEILEKCGYHVLQASNGEEALALSRTFNKPIRLLFTDVVMPGMTGRELADRLIVERREMKVLYTSGYTDRAIVDHGVLETGVAYLPKPFTPDGLAAKIRDVLGEPKAPVSILVVDDEPGVRGLMSEILTGAGYRVIEACNGKAAMKIVAAQPIALVITDLVMPEQEGLETLQQIRRSNSGAKVIAVSGSARGPLPEGREIPRRFRGAE